MLAVVLALLASGVVNCSVPDDGSRTSSDDDEVGISDPVPAADTPPTYFATLAPGSRLPSGSQCEQWVRPAEEVVPENTPYNEATGTSVVGETYLSKDIEAADLEARVDGQYTGTTDEILQWGACKWGFDEDLVRAQAYVESTWFAGKLGDCGEQTQPETGGEGGCASVGIMQVRSAHVDPTFPGVWPESWSSTAFNVDYALAVKRACFEGREVWLQLQPDRQGDYESGDEWGCMGRWFSGTWYNDLADEYLGWIRVNLDERSWRQHAGCPDWESNFYCSDLDREIDDQ